MVLPLYAIVSVYLADLSIILYLQNLEFPTPFHSQQCWTIILWFIDLLKLYIFNKAAFLKWAVAAVLNFENCEVA